MREKEIIRENRSIFREDERKSYNEQAKSEFNED
jgi:hypothetical protein